MKRTIELDEADIKIADKLYKMLVGNPNVQESIKKQGYVDLRIKTEHWFRILAFLVPKVGEEWKKL